MRLQHIAIAFALVTAGFADTITLKSGRVVNGTYLGGTARQVRVEVGDQIQTLNIADISRIEFGASSSYNSFNNERPSLRREPAPVEESNRPILRRADQSPNVMRPAPPPPAAAPARASVELPAGTNIVVRMIDGVDSEVARVGQTFQGSLDEPIMVNGESIVPRGADVALKLVDSKDSGKFTGRAELTLDLVSLMVNGRMVEINTQTVTRESENSQGSTTAKRAAGVGAVGAIIGAIAGGGKGAAIGAAAGGAAGAGTGIITKGQKVKIPSETRLTFVLDSAVKI
jgi:hypothetical protein